MTRTPTTPPTPDRLGKGLKRLREGADLLQAEAAKILGVDRKTMNRLELGRSQPFSRWGGLEPVIERAILEEFRRRLVGQVIRK